MKQIAINIPEETFTAARNIYNIQHVYLRIGDQLSQILRGTALELLDPSTTLNNSMIFRLALVTAFQYAETLPDPLATDAVRQRMDWKYALFLPVNFPGISSAALCQFRSNLLSSSNGMEAFGGLLKNLTGFGLLVQPVDARLAITFICALTRLYWMRQAMKAALSLLGSTSPDWLRGMAPVYWYDHYRKSSELQPGSLPSSDSGVEDEANRIGADAFILLEIARQGLPVEILERAEMRNLSSKFDEQYSRRGSQIQWLAPACGYCSCRFPFDSHLT